MVRRMDKSGREDSPVHSELPTRYKGTQGLATHQWACAWTWVTGRRQEAGLERQQPGDHLAGPGGLAVASGVDVQAVSEKPRGDRRRRENECSVPRAVQAGCFHRAQNTSALIPRPCAYCSRQQLTFLRPPFPMWEGHNLVQESPSAWMCRFLLRNASIRWKNGINFQRKQQWLNVQFSNC